MHLRDRVFNSVKRRPKSGRGSFAAMSPTRSTFPSLLSPASTTFLFYIARSILQPLESLSPHLAALFQNVPSRISFRELSFVLSRHFFLILLFTAVHPTFNSHSTTMLYFPNAMFVSTISSCVLKQLFFLVSLTTWIITSPARKAPSLPFFHSVLFCSLTLQAYKVKDESP